MYCKDDHINWILVKLVCLSVFETLFISMEKTLRTDELPEDVASDDCLTSYMHIYSPDLLK